MRTKAVLSLALVWTTLFTSIPRAETRTHMKQDPQETTEDDAEDGGLRFRLSEAQTEAEARPTPNPTAAAEPLSEDETARLLSRLPAITDEPDDVQSFRLRESSLPPPRAGATIQAAFAPVASGGAAPSRTSAPLEVVRVAPEGPVALAPAVSVTFSQPLVAVASQTEAASNVPVTLTPQPSGAWRWLGSQTLVFQPSAEGGRLPMATEYTLTIPAGTRSALGNALAATKTVKFSTPPPALKSSYPSGEGRARDELMFLEFDQRVDPARVLAQIRTQPTLRLRQATKEEIAADAEVSNLAKQSQEGRWLALRAVNADGTTKNALPSDATIKVIIPAGTPSAEGPRVTLKEQSFSFKTYGPLRVTEAKCGYSQRCTPFDDFNITFSNTLDAVAFRASQVRVAPTIPGVKVSVSDNSINIEGAKRSNTTYTVTVDPSVKDIFGQTLTGRNQLTFKVGTSDPALFSSAEGEFVVLDPAGRRAFSVYSINYRRLKVQFYRVGPEDWPRFRAYQAARRRRSPRDKQPEPAPPGQLVLDRVVEVRGTPEEHVETSIDLSPALTNGFGHVFIRVLPADEGNAPAQVYAYRENRVEAWVQSTQIALDAFSDREQLVVWANSLRDGSPLSRVSLRVEPSGVLGGTSTNGVAQFDHKALESIREPRPALIIARKGQDTAILPRDSSPYNAANDSTHWREFGTSERISWYVFDDRKLYRPGEEVSVKGWVRRAVLKPRGDTELFASGGSISYVLEDSQGNEITKGEARVNALAGFDLKLQLPATMNLGHAQLELKIKDAEGREYEHTHAFQVQEFRRPEFEITAEAAGAPHFVGAHATVTARAAYYAGGGLAGTEINWDVTARPTTYTPPNRDDYTFGKFRPWWGGDDEEYGETTEEEFKGVTDSTGRHALRIDFDSVRPALPSSVTAEATVQDVNRQTIAATETLLVHPSETYVGLRPARTFVQKGQPFDVSAIVTDIDGRALAGRDIRLRLVRLDYVFEDGEWEQEEVDAQEQVIKSGAEAVRVQLRTGEGGVYRLKAQVRDDRERLNETELTLWVAGGKRPPQREIEQEDVELIPDRKTYAGGDVAEILVQSPFTPAEGILTLRRSGLLRTERFRLSGYSHTLRVPIEEAMTPNVHVQVDLVGASVRVDDEGKELERLPKRPAYASGELNLEVPPASRRLKVDARPRETVLKPGAETVVEVEVRDAEGRAVGGADTAVVVVDESVLALTDYKLEDPLSIFYAGRGEDTDDYHTRENIQLDDPGKLMIGGGGPGGGGGGFVETAKSARMQSSGFGMLVPGVAAETVTVTASGDASYNEPSSLIALRRNFNALAVFAASLPTDAAGRAQVKVKLPDNLTRYRVMAVTVAGGRLAGKGESAVTARLPLMARPSAPRFLNYGDAAELPVVLQNQTDKDVSVSVAVRAANATLTAGAGRRVTVPAQNRVEVRFPIAAERPGTARFQVAAMAGTEADAAFVSLPVYTPATTEAFATYGTIDAGAIAQPVRAPADALKTFGGLEVTTSSTQLQELTDAFIYLYNYPFECSEQIASRVLSIAALRDVLTAFKTKDLPSPERIRETVAADIKRLEALQNDDGGFGFWRRGERSNPFVTVHVAHALARAEQKDISGVSEDISNSVREYLRQIEQKIPAEYSVESKRAIQGYALFVRQLMQDRDAGRARKLIADAGGVENLSLETLGWLLPVLSGDAASSNEVQAIRRHLNNRVTETAGAAHFADSYSDGEYTILHSDRRADGVLLDALITDQPASDLIPKLVRGLLGGRKKGRWANTQENVFILLALDRYFNTFERDTPDFTARVWLGAAYAGEQAFKGRSIDRQQINIPMTELASRTAAAPADLTISKEGTGRLYFRVGATYAPSNLKLDAADYGFRVERTYEAVDDPSDVRRDAEGTWHIKAGARVRVRVSMFAPARRYHVALVDPLPAGLEALNPALATTESLPEGSNETVIFRGGRGVTNYYWLWRGPWYEHQNLRDERAEAFTSLLWEGEHEYSYFARATTPGLFVVPPPKAEEMYSPETFGRGRTDRVKVE